MSTQCGSGDGTMVDGEWCIVDSAGLVARSSWLIARPPAPFDRLRVTVEGDGEERFWLMGKIGLISFKF